MKKTKVTERAEEKIIDDDLSWVRG